jgi:hypothetical protein
MTSKSTGGGAPTAQLLEDVHWALARLGLAPAGPEPTRRLGRAGAEAVYRGRFAGGRERSVRLAAVRVGARGHWALYALALDGEDEQDAREAHVVRLREPVAQPAPPRAATGAAQESAWIARLARTLDYKLFKDELALRDAGVSPDLVMLPEEALLQVVQFLDISWVAVLLRVCQRFRGWGQGDAVWAALLARDFAESASAPAATSGAGNNSGGSAAASSSGALVGTGAGADTGSVPAGAALALYRERFRDSARLLRAARRARGR